MTVAVAPAAAAADLDAARVLMREYARAHEHAPCFDTLERELASLPGAWAPPGGCLLLARDGARAVGCVAVRPAGGRACEMARLYVVPGARGAGIGRALAEAALACARAAGHRVMRLETLTSMTAARALYRSLGFVEAGEARVDRGAAVIAMTRALD